MPKTTTQHDSVDCWNLGVHLGESFEDTRKKAPQKQPSKTARVDENHLKISPRPPSERRAWKRFVIDGAVAGVEKPSLLPFMKPAHVTLGPIKDISMKGVAVQYIKKNNSRLSKSRNLSIMHPEEGVVVDNIPFIIVNNFKVADLPDGKEVWNLCAAFGRLSSLQKIRIESLVNDYGNEIKFGRAGLQAAASAD